MKMGSRILTIARLLLIFLPISLLGDARIIDMKVAVSAENLREHVQKIHFDRSPYSEYQGLGQASDYIYQGFLKLGLRVWKEYFEWDGKWFHNVVAEKKGTFSTEKVIVLGAHYDTVLGSPGADDNASGVAVLLEVAKNIQSMTLGTTVKFIAFGLEEYGYAGSTHYAEKAKKNGEKIIGMISLEMVGFTSPRQNYPPRLMSMDYPNVGNFIGIIGNESSRVLFEKVRQSFRTHIPQLPVESLLVPGKGEGIEGVRLSDHSSFWDQDFPALMVTDTAFLRNPNYHLPTDTIETLNFEFMRNVATSIFYSVVELAR